MTGSELGSIGGLELVGRLSTGGVGEVFLARRVGPRGFQKQVVVKTLRADLEDRDDLRRMFFDEARLVARLDHPAICQVYEFGEENGALYMVMEHVAGVTLAELGDRIGGRCPPAIAARIGEEALRGLHAAHEARDEDGVPLGVVHRDVSPGNLMLTHRGRVKIVDFGIALMRGRNAPSTQVGTVRGKYAYIAPEQMRPGAIDRRADIYGMAIVLYELVKGSPLFSNHARREVSANELELDARDRELAAIIARGLALEPEARFENAHLMAEALAAFAAGRESETLEQFALRTIGEAPAPKPTDRGPTLVDGDAPRETTKKKRAPLWIGAVAMAAIGAAAWWSYPSKLQPPPASIEHAIVAPEPAQTIEVRAEPAPAPLEEKRAVKKRPRAPAAATTPRAIEAPPAQPIRAPGTVSINADPYMIVVVDGVDLGLTPILRHSVAAGAHQIDFLEPANRSVVETRKIEIDPQEHERVLFKGRGR